LSPIVMESRIYPFDAGALYLALDAQRTERGLSWKGVADQIWELSSDLNDRRNDHPISPSTPVLGAVTAPTAVLIRPDGYVAWVGEGTDTGLRAALTTWFGTP
jgi:hypothetical protein